MDRKEAIILCSGGLDSVTTAYHVKKSLGYKKINILFFNYEQTGLSAERKCAQSCAKELNASFQEVILKDMPKSKTSEKKIKRKDLKNTEKESANWYIPGRNNIFLSYALSKAEAIFLKEDKMIDIFVGFKSEGKESYPDTTPEFIQAINKVSRISTKAKANIIAPFIKKDKEDIITIGAKLGVDFNKTFSCYTGKAQHCGYCLSCRLRQEGFYWANILDPTVYKNQMPDA